MIEKVTLENLRHAQSIHTVERARYSYDDPKDWVVVLVGKTGKPIFLPSVPSDSRWFLLQLVQAVTGVVFIRDQTRAWVRTEEPIAKVGASKTHQPLTLQNLRSVRELHFDSLREPFAMYLGTEQRGRLALNASSTQYKDNDPSSVLWWASDYLWVLNIVRCVTGREFRCWNDGDDGIWRIIE
jgi:hypothetical protein